MYIAVEENGEVKSTFLTTMCPSVTYQPKQIKEHHIFCAVLIPVCLFRVYNNDNRHHHRFEKVKKGKTISTLKWYYRHS